MAITTSRKVTIKKTSTKSAAQNEKSGLHEKLQEYFGFNSFKGEQEAIINCLLSGKDTFVIMPTGGVKVYVTSCPHWLVKGLLLSYLRLLP